MYEKACRETKKYSRKVEQNHKIAQNFTRIFITRVSPSMLPIAPTVEFLLATVVLGQFFCLINCLKYFS